MKQEKYIVQAMGMNSLKYGGLEEFLVLLSKELKKDNIRLILVYNSVPKSAKFIEDAKKAGCLIYVYKTKSTINYLIGLYKINKKYNPIIFHGHFEFHLTVIFAKLFFRKKVFLTLHGMITDKDSHVIKDPGKLKTKTKIIRFFINCFCDKIFSVSNAIRDQYVQFFPKTKTKIQTHYIGTNLNNINIASTANPSESKTEKTIIGNIAFFSPVKGLDVLIESLYLLKHKFKRRDFHLLQIGLDLNIPQSQYLLSLAEEKGINDNITWHGVIDYAKEMLIQMDIYCQPSRSEGIPLSIMEACMAGLPIVASNTGGIPELVINNENGLLFEVENSYELAEKLNYLLENEALLMEMGLKSRILVQEKFDLQKQTQKMAKTYLNALADLS